MKFDVIIVGAGAAGLAAANVLLEQKLNILLLEKEAVPGRKLSASGNGKCNLTNADYAVGHYHSYDEERKNALLATYSESHVVDFMEHMGILLYEKHGYYYPLSNQAKQVTSLLQQRLTNGAAVFLCGARVTNIEKRAVSEGKNGGNGDFTVSVQLAGGETKKYTSGYVILATGGLAAGKLGGCDDGYRISKGLGLLCTELYPALSPIYVEDSHLSALKGVRLDGEAALKNPEGKWVRERGQIQFQAEGISGICIMNLSGIAWHLTKEQRKDALFIDTLPDFSWDDVKIHFMKWQSKVPEFDLLTVLNGMFPEGYNRYLLERLSMETGKKMGELHDKQINRLTSHIKKLTFTPCRKRNFEKAQVTGGGISLKEVDLESLESLRCPGFYPVGELLDVHGDCGGYNLTFAICSGIKAAKDILRKWDGGACKQPLGSLTSGINRESDKGEET